MLDILIKTEEVYERFSGLRINRKKSSISGINIDNVKLNQVTSRLHCKIEYLPSFISWSPHGGHPKNASLWHPVKERILKKLDTWNASNFREMVGQHFVI